MSRDDADMNTMGFRSSEELAQWQKGQQAMTQQPKTGIEKRRQGIRASGPAERPSGAEPADFNLRDADLAALLPGTYYMDPPDGGDVSLFEQLRRMSMDAAKWRRSAERPSGAELPALTREQNIALREGHEFAAEEAYFTPRPVSDGAMPRRAFREGFDRGWDARALLAASSRSAAEAPLETLGREYGLDLTGPPDAA